MPLKKWEKSLPNGFWMAYQKETIFGVWIRFSVVLIFNDECITRYDSAHGSPHRDVLGKQNGLIEKVWHGTMSMQEAFEYASRDLATNYRIYYDFYSAH